MKKILGLDLGANSIGWAVVNAETIETDKISEEKITGIEAVGSRIIPMGEDVLGNFGNGVSVSVTKERTDKRGTRRLLERSLLRRERLFRVLHILGFLPEHFDAKIGFDRDNTKTFGKFIDDSEPKLAWKINELGKYEFLFKNSFEEMVKDFQNEHPDLLLEGKKLPYDWVIYYLRKKALTQKIEKEELAWILLQFNQKRGYYQLRGEEEEEKPNKLVEFYALKVIDVEATEDKKGKNIWYNIKLENGWIYRRASSERPDWVGKIKEFIVTTDLNDDGTEKLDKDGNVKRSFRMPNPEDWTLLKKKTEKEP